MRMHHARQADTGRLLPLFWMKGESERALRDGVAAVEESGCGALVAESRTHPNYLGEGWWRDLGIVLEECQNRGMKLYVFDDRHFPSGYASGGAENTDCARMLLKHRYMDVSGPVKGGAFVVLDDARASRLRKGEGVVAVVAARRGEVSARNPAYEDIGGYALDACIDITDTVRDGMAYWDVPDGLWRVFVLESEYVWERQPPKQYVNPLLPQSADIMLRTVYQPHYEHFKSAFGSTFMGFFSDEPSLRAGRGYHGVLGEYPLLPIPWRADMPGILERLLQKSALPLLPGLWYDIGSDTPLIRYAVMDTVSRLYGENYSAPIGQWCAAHGVEYVGHVIEQNNAHCRLGSGAGHYFRAMSGQSMAGIDIVLHEICPALRGGTHAWKSQDFEADDDFFRYMLGQTAVSCAYLDEKKRGRTLCEIFGAYGWQEDAGDMRYLANLMLARGVNHFSPHAFTLAPFPDPDSPPHFDARMNPQMPFIRDVFAYMARMCALLSGGAPLCKTAVLYYAEAEWGNGTAGCMKTQTVVKALNERQIDCAVVPMDALPEADFDLLLIPWARAVPQKLLDLCAQWQARGKTVYFIDAPPDRVVDSPAAKVNACVPAVPLDKAAALARQDVCRALTAEPRVHVFPYQSKGDTLLFIMNEDTRETLDFAFATDEARSAYLLDMESETCEPLRDISNEKDRALCVRIAPGQLVVVLFTNGQPPYPAAPRRALGQAFTASPSQWSVSLKGAGEDAFIPYARVPQPVNITSPERLPRFCGTVRYQAEVVLSSPCAAIALGACSGAVRLWLDGADMGARVAPPYAFPVPSCGAGAHQLCIEMTNTAVFAHRDALSFYACVKPTGLFGPLTFYREGELL